MNRFSGYLYRSRLLKEEEVNLCVHSLWIMKPECVLKLKLCIVCIVFVNLNTIYGIFTVLPPAQGCVPGVNKPMFLTQTPLHGDVHHATVGQAHEITLQAQVADNRSE